MIFGIYTTSYISNLLYVFKFHEPLGEWNLRHFWNITSGIYAKYLIQIMPLFVYTTTRKSFVIFTCKYFKLSWNSTALSQSNCRNFSCSSIKYGIDNKLIETQHTNYHLLICKNRPKYFKAKNPLKLDLDAIFLSRESVFQAKIT